MIFFFNVLVEPLQDQSLKQLVGMAQHSLKLFASDGTFLGFRSASTFVCCQSFGDLILATKFLMKRSNQYLAFDPNSLMSSVWMSSVPVALLLMLT